MHVLEGDASTIRWTATTRAASWRRRDRGEPAHEVLGEHRQALLGLVMAGEPAGQHVERLVGTVDMGHHVGPDLVLEQRIDP